MRTHRFPLALAGIVLSAFALGACTGEALESTPVDTAERDSSEAYPNAQNGDKEAASEAPPTAAAAAPAQARPQPAPRPPACDNCGTIAAIEAVEEKGKGTGAGAVGGAAAGGVIGHQIGGGSGKDIATVVGAIAGGIAGHKAEEKLRSKTTYRVTVQLESGGSRVFRMEDASHLYTGQRVAVYDNGVVPRR
ncbi:glycine zipper 2TM domain-containing protein [Algiphilus sp.]|uniref:glycine zipper 2TM domain-containing protein n=1 Tax=Algiphilus sp. TaxID=1872431 RepID=UPI003B516DF6